VKSNRTKDSVDPILGRILAEKRLTRQQLAHLPIGKKIEILVEMQKTAWAIHHPKRGHCVHVWKI
jgi:hypothetical protein